MTDQLYNVLFLCTGNSARSILAEAILNREGRGRFRAFSAGSQPKGDVHPAALELMEELGFSTADCRSKKQRALTRKTLAARRKGEKRKILLDHLLERAEGRPVSEDELEKLRMRIAETLREQLAHRHD